MTCLEPGCKVRQPIYNIRENSKGLYCSVHKKENMIDVKHERCIEPNCGIRPTYNIRGLTKGLHCFEHKKVV